MQLTKKQLEKMIQELCTDDEKGLKIYTYGTQLLEGFHEAMKKRYFNSLSSTWECAFGGRHISGEQCTCE